MGDFKTSPMNSLLGAWLMAKLLEAERLGPLHVVSIMSPPTNAVTLDAVWSHDAVCLLYTSPSPRD